MPRAIRRPTPGRVPALAALLAVLLAVAGAVLPAAAPSLPLPSALVPRVARAADDLDIQTAAKYVVDPARHRVRVTIDVTAVNRKPNVASGGTATRYFFDGVNLGIQPEATKLRATQDGAALDVKAVNRPGFRLVTVAFHDNIYFQESAKLRLAFDLPAGAPRSDSDVRVGSAFATFVAWAFGDRGSVRVEAPSDFQVDMSGDTMGPAAGPDGAQAWVATTTVPLNWYASVNATNDANLTHETLSLADGEQVVVRAWPEDERWLTRVRSLLTRGVPELVGRIGLPWPVKGPLTVTEVHTPLLEGYAGFYDPTADTITISEDLDDLTIVHEASHAWFNKALYGERWINEGLADEYASRALVTLGRRQQGPEPVKRSAKAAFPLEHWPPPAPIRDAERDAEERYGYDAAWTAMRAIVAAVGEDGMRRVFAATAAKTSAYPGEEAAEQTRLPNDWRRFLDLAEAQAPSPKAADAVERSIRRWALEDADAKLLAPRTAARAAYVALVAKGGTWSPPDAVRTAMDGWRFGPATDGMDAATTVLEARDEVAAVADAQGLRPPSQVESRYQDADTAAELAVLGDELRSSTDALHHLGAASGSVAAPRDWLTELGLDGQDPAASLAAARTAWERGELDAATAGADAAVAMLAAAPEAGRSRATTIGLGIGVVVVVLLLVLAALVARRRRRHAAAHRAAPAGWPAPYATLPPDGPPSGPTPAPSPRDEGAP
jgi:hypothetical protein